MTPSKQKTECARAEEGGDGNFIKLRLDLEFKVGQAAHSAPGVGAGAGQVVMGEEKNVLVLLFDLGLRGRCWPWLFFYGVTTCKFIFLPKLDIPESLLSFLPISFIDFDPIGFRISAIRLTCVP